MKVVALILSVYLLLLSIVPCCLFDECPEDKIEYSARHESGDGDCGNCSPFFTCSGCPGVTISESASESDMVLRNAGSTYGGYLLSPIPDMYYEFWQPPRLS